MLTRQQANLLDFLIMFETQHGYCPSFDEMKDALHLKSKSGIHRLVSGLEERGFIRRLHHRARAITTKPTPTLCPACGYHGESSLEEVPLKYSA